MLTVEYDFLMTWGKQKLGFRFIYLWQDIFPVITIYEGIVFVQSRLIMVKIHKHTFWKRLTFIIQPALVMPYYIIKYVDSPDQIKISFLNLPSFLVGNAKFVLENGQISHLDLNQFELAQMLYFWIQERMIDETIR